jgi:hypothetical protein
VSCIGGVIRWENDDLNMFVLLDTSTVDWTIELGDLFDAEECCADVDEGDDLCACTPPDNCAALPDFIITETCTTYLKEVACTRYTENGQCDYVVALRVTAIDGGSGSAACA